MPPHPDAQDNPVRVDLTAVLVAADEGNAFVLTPGNGASLPSGPLEPDHRSLQAGMRSWVERQTQHAIGHVEQLYTFGDKDRGERAGDQRSRSAAGHEAAPGARPSDGDGDGDGPGARAGEAREASGQVRSISISYLALTRRDPNEGGWRSWYDFFPWEDRRDEAGRRAGKRVVDDLAAWCDAAAGSARADRRRRMQAGFGLGDRWNDELVLQRYELLYEAGLVPEAGTGGTVSAGTASPGETTSGMGRPMYRDHRRILATGIARLRARIRYNPVFFELMPDSFTLLQLQTTVEALAGVALHKQNFRRLIEQQALVEETGASADGGRGRPAKLFRFRREVMQARQMAGSRLPLARTGRGPVG
ncbi:NUDIX hydrolase [Rhizosaccharibacter radicis]|uniref:NrtR DNA-binding winged helix domain-containing protein n=1 Tax=Rhizosaccharibacter radicis TaxID=2782605 RepID=A0ABT1VWP8_9PROT|nr:hypothetical protein [Acetobacteraceae bacterium KSS12]